MVAQAEAGTPRFQAEAVVSGQVRHESLGGACSEQDRPRTEFYVGNEITDPCAKSIPQGWARHASHSACYSQPNTRVGLRPFKEATARRFHYDTHDQLQRHLADFVAVTCNFVKRLKTLKGLTLYEFFFCRDLYLNAGSEARSGRTWNQRT